MEESAAELLCFPLRNCGVRAELVELKDIAGNKTEWRHLGCAKVGGMYK